LNSKTFGEFIEVLESNAPASLVRAIEPHFMLGTIGINDATETFLILKLNSYENTFAGMLQWEKSLALDLGSMFSTSLVIQELPPEISFIDLTDRNKDIRALTYENIPVLLYSFLEKEVLIITESVEALRSLIERLNREKLSR
jgi:hypothetical protein